MKNYINRNISKSDSIPIIQNSDLFTGNEKSRFVLCVFPGMDVLTYEQKNNQLIEGYLKLRANVYIDRASILGEENRRFDGTELDKFDEHSVHFVVYENFENHIAVVASMRLIIKKELKTLPLETLYKDMLSRQIINRSVEVSRFIVCHDEKKTHQKLKAKLIIEALKYVCNEKLGPVYGIVEKRLQRSLSMFGVDTESIAEPIIVKEGGTNGEDKHDTELVLVMILTNGLEEKLINGVAKIVSTQNGDRIYWN